MQMSDHEMEVFADKVAVLISEKFCNVDSRNVCPIGLTLAQAKTIRNVISAFWWTGAIFAGTLIAAFASGFGYVVWQGFKYVVSGFNGRPPDPLQ